MRIALILSGFVLACASSPNASPSGGANTSAQPAASPAAQPAAPPAAAASLTWGPAPAVFPAGAQMAVVSGDPAKAEQFTVQLSMPDGYRIAPHFHPTAEHVTVQSGTLLVGMGDSLDLAAAKPMSAGEQGEIAANMHHFAATRGATVISVSAMGPFAMTYVNPADMPRPAGATPTPR